MIKIIVILLIILCVVGGIIIFAKKGLENSRKGSAHNQFPVLTGEYLGQEKPGLVPELFAPGIVSTDGLELSIAFSPDGKEVFFDRKPKSPPSADTVIMYMKLEENGWTPPQPAPFSYKANEFEPNLSPDGKKLFYASGRPMPGGKKDKFPMWVVEKTSKGWGKPRPLGSPINDGFAMYVTAANDGTLYYTSMQGIVKTKWVDGHYSKPEKLDEAINYLSAAHPFIAPDESYIIVDARGPSTGNIPDLYISFRNQDGSWTKARNMGSPINTKYMEMCATVSPDGKYLFFCRNGSIYWVDSKIIENYREK